MNINEIKELLLTIDKTNLGYVKLQHGDLHLEVSKESAIKNRILEDYSNINEEVLIEDEQSNQVNVSNDNIHIIKAPLMGTFYEAGSPDEDPFVKVGDRVNAKSPLCIVEAMKLMNEITSDVDGEIIEILVQNEDLVEYNQPLFKIKVG